jgi:sugar lactone lactonase YvrE
VRAIEGFRTPESVLYDSTQDVFYISNVNGVPDQKDDNGFISRVPADSAGATPVTIAQGGKNRVTLNAPKGLAMIGDTLWVADIDAVRAFNKNTGAPVATVDLSRQKAVFLNDVVVGGDGALYITDTGIRFRGGNVVHPGPDRVFRIGPDRSVSVIAQGDSLNRPNGITWDARGNRFIVVAFGGKQIMALRPGSKNIPVIGYGAGQMDGVELLPDGRLLVSSWADSTVAIRDGNRTTEIHGLPSPADIGVDRKRLRVAVPLFMENRVELYSIPPRQ